MLRYWKGRPFSVLTFDCAEDKIQAIYLVTNPDKLVAVPRLAEGSAIYEPVIAKRAKAGPTEVLVRVGAVSLNYRDKLIVEGFYNPEMRFPLTQVADAVGHVVEVGEEVVRLRVGDRVIANYCTHSVDGAPQYNEGSHSMGNTMPGALAEYFVLDQRALVKAPDYLSDDGQRSAACSVMPFRITPHRTLCPLSFDCDWN